ncbi:TonB-dependent receptor plug domain-containing protein [bacterium]|nr:TonB-dependent receptor plug domain-containing protein [bacterium]
MNIRTPALSLLLAAFVFFTTASVATRPVAAQTPTGTITGTVVNSSTQEPLAGANVVVVGSELGAATDLDGRYEIRNVPVGTHGVTASVVGYRTDTVSDVIVTAAKPAVVDFELLQMELQLEEVTFTTGYFRETPDRPVSTTIQSSEEIRRLPGGFEDVVRAVSILPGVAQVSAGRNDLIVRGGSPAENLYVVDGIRVPNINHFGTQGFSGGPQSYINLDFVDNTEFSTGGFGARYGDRLSSVLSIDLRNGREDRFGGKGTISATQFGLNLEGPLSEDGTFLFSARRSYLDFIFKAADFNFVPEYWDFLFKSEYDITPRDQVTLLGITALDNVRLFNDDEEARYENSRVLAPSQVNAVGGLSWRHLFGKGFVTTTLGQSFVQYDTEQQAWDPSNPSGGIETLFKNQSYEHENSLRSDLVLPLTRRTDFTAGVVGKGIRFHADVELDSTVDSFGDTLYTDSEYDTLAWKFASYAQISHKFDYLRWTVGGRLDYFNWIENPVALSPRMSVQVPFKGRFNLNGSVGIYRQTPSYIWLVGDPQNRVLEYISAYQYVVGFDYNFRKDSRVKVELYYKDYYDYPVSESRPYLTMANTGAGFGGIDEGFASFGLDPLVSEGSGWARGVELTLQKRFSEVPWYGLLAVSLNESKFRAQDGVLRPSSFDQRVLLNVGGGYILSEKWEISGKFRFATGRPYTPFNPDGTQDVEDYNSRRLDPNHSVDLRVDRRWFFSNYTIIGYIDVQNVYGFQFNEPPQWNYREMKPEEPGGIGVLPSIGISLEF